VPGQPSQYQGLAMMGKLFARLDDSVSYRMIPNMCPPLWSSNTKISDHHPVIRKAR